MSDDERDILLARYFDGSATDEQLESLNRAAAADPMVARAMLSAAAQDLSLQDALTAVPVSQGRPFTFDAPHRDSVSPNGAAMNGAKVNGKTSNGKHFQPANGAPNLTAAEPANPLRIASAETAATRTSWFSRSRMWMSIAASVLIAAGAVYYMTRATSQPATSIAKNTPSSSQPLAVLTPLGSGVVVEHQGIAQGAAADIAVSRDDVIRTNGSPAAFVYAQEHTRVTLAPLSRLSLAGDLANKRLELLSGSINCDVQKQQPGKPLIISTPQGRVQVVGTRFDVTSHGDWTRVDVSQGTVRVTRTADGSTVDVSAGEYVYCGKSTANPTGTPAGFSTAGGRNLSDYWSTKVKPAGIEH